MSCGKIYTLNSPGACQLEFVDLLGNVIAVNLDGAVAYEQKDPMGVVEYIQVIGRNSGVKVDPTSGITLAEIQAEIDACHSQNTITQDDTASQISLTPERQVLEGAATWNLPANAHSVQINVITVGDVLNPPTTTTASHTNQPLFASEQGGWSVSRNIDNLLQTPLTVTTFANDVVVIYYSTF